MYSAKLARVTASLLCLCALVVANVAFMEANPSARASVGITRGYVPMIASDSATGGAPSPTPPSGRPAYSQLTLLLTDGACNVRHDPFGPATSFPYLALLLGPTRENYDGIRYISPSEPTAAGPSLSV